MDEILALSKISTILFASTAVSMQLTGLNISFDFSQQEQQFRFLQNQFSLKSNYEKELLGARPEIQNHSMLWRKIK
jgi:hypothetical protein